MRRQLARKERRETERHKQLLLEEKLKDPELSAQLDNLEEHSDAAIRRWNEHVDECAQCLHATDLVSNEAVRRASCPVGQELGDAYDEAGRQVEAFLQGLLG